MLDQDLETCRCGYTVCSFDRKKAWEEEHRAIAKVGVELERLRA